MTPKTRTETVFVYRLGENLEKVLARLPKGTQVYIPVIKELATEMIPEDTESWESMQIFIPLESPGLKDMTF